jgi:DNA mismatch repair protein MutS
MVNAERYITPELKEKEALVLNARNAMLAREQALFRELSRELSRHGAELLGAAAWLAGLDVGAALAALASRYRWVRPRLLDKPGIEIVGGRHPLVEAALGPGRFVPNDLHLGQECTIVLLSGPNMAGKSTYLRQAAMIVLLAQVGSFVPAAAASIGLCDRIFTRIGAHDELAKGLSTFMVEMVEAAHILLHATQKSLLIFDEVGRGTSTYDGVSIAQAILEYLHDAPQLRALTLFATHYHELTRLAGRLDSLSLHHVRAREWKGDLVLLHELVDGAADRSYGIAVAKLAGLPPAVVARAKAVLAKLEAGRDATGGLAAGLDDLPLFAAAAEPEQVANPVVDALETIDPDALTPRQALEALYRLKRLVADQ